MIRLDADQRRQRQEHQRALREIDAPIKAARREEAKARERAREPREPKVQHERSKPKGGRERDPAFMSWQHDSGLVCVACEIEGRPTPAMLKGERNPIEVAHQRVNGWKKGVRGNDADSCPLCRWHHQLAPSACDKGQRQFWDRLGIDAADYCAALYAAFRGGSDGRRVQLRFIPRRPA